MGAIDTKMETMESRLQEAVREAAEHATGSAEEAAELARQRASESAEAVTYITGRLSEADELLKNLRRVHGISTDIAVGGSHDKTSQAESALANEWRERSIRYRWWTAAAAAAYTASTIAFPPEGLEWALRSPLGASAVFILGWMAKYSSDQSSEHRTAANIYKHQSLAFASLRHYAQDIADMSGSGSGGDQDLDEDSRNEEIGPNTTPGLLSGEILKTLFTNQIDAFTERIKSSDGSERGYSGRRSKNTSAS